MIWFASIKMVNNSNKICVGLSQKFAVNICWCDEITFSTKKSHSNNCKSCSNNVQLEACQCVTCMAFKAQKLPNQYQIQHHRYIILVCNWLYYYENWLPLCLCTVFRRVSGIQYFVQNELDTFNRITTKDLDFKVITVLCQFGRH